jgi:hypothetical protein
VSSGTVRRFTGCKAATKEIEDQKICIAGAKESRFKSRKEKNSNI